MMAMPLTMRTTTITGAVDFTSTLETDWDQDGCRDSDEDEDDDNDGVSDVEDGCATGVIGTLNDQDGDGCDNSEDPDDDGDAIECFKEIRAQ